MLIRVVIEPCQKDDGVRGGDERSSKEGILGDRVIEGDRLLLWANEVMIPDGRWVEAEL